MKGCPDCDRKEKVHSILSPFWKAKDDETDALGELYELLRERGDEDALNAWRKVQQLRMVTQRAEKVVTDAARRSVA